MKTLHGMFALVAIFGIGAVADAAPAKFKGSQFASQAKIKLASARQIALKARPGTVTDQELEKEKGGSGLRYSFDITSHGKPYEVGVDARTGAVLENGVEGKNPD
ncbi:peptidase M4 [Sphingomonas melonis]|uniref:Peptidase M4 n=1 Tax=Sphingomonas melonis TaxID=152682 RepID=A0A0D1KNH1_9SPHN|nr:PepSY domain-containing protein [uncultured Sphingomonas sp.]KIU26014.1 peptidase M4 [Sphingomonas melonis]